MAIREKVVLVDEYSQKAKRIESSTSAMGEAMKKIKGTAAAMGSALKSAFDRSYKVNINEIGSEEIRGKVNNLQKSLNSISKGTYKVDISAKMSMLEKLKSNIESIKSKFSGEINKKTPNLVMDYSSIENYKKIIDDVKKSTNFKSKMVLNASTSSLKNARKVVDDLKKSSNFKSKINIFANVSSVIKANRTISNFKSKFDGLKSKAIKFRADVSALKNARKEAKSLSKQLTAFTGKKHKVRVDFEKSSNLMKFFGGGFKEKLSAIGGGFKNVFSSIGSKFSSFGSSFRRNQSSDSGGGFGGASIMKSIIGGNLITSAITKGLNALSNVAKSTIGAGFNRLTSIESDKARLRGFGYDNKKVNQVTKAATAAVTGTQYSMGDAMTASSGAIAAGIKPGELEGYLKEVGNAAAATGSDFNEVASIMNKVKTTGHLQADEMRQLSDRGLPVLAKLAENAGVSVDEMSKRISKGSVSFDEFRGAVKKASGTAADEVAKTWGGAKDNFKSALSKLGAGLLGGNDKEDGEQGGLFGMMTPGLLKVNKLLNDLVPIFKDAGDKIKDFVTTGFENLKGAFSKVSEFLSPVFEKMKGAFDQVSSKIAEVWGPLKEKFTTVFDKLSEAFAPLKDSLGQLFGTIFEGEGNKLSSFIDLVAQGLTTFADILIAASPYIQSAVEWIAANVIPVISDIISWVTGTLIPTVNDAMSTIIQTVMPIIEAIVDFIGGVVLPILQALGDLIMGAVTTAFNIIKDVVQWTADKFNELIGAIGSAVSAFFDIPRKIGEALGGIGEKIAGLFGGGKKGHATGTEYFQGGLTRVNERGEEMIQLARGDKIYPAGKTDRIIRNEVKNNSSSNVDRSVDSSSIVINVNGANMTNKDVGRVISDELKRLGVVV